MAARSKARKRALDVLFEADSRREPIDAVLSRALARADVPGAPPVPEHTTRLVRGVQEHLLRLDELLTERSEGWDLDRMPAVDRAVLRLGAFELLGCDDVPDGVAISEAVELVADLSTDDSPRFVNGVLARLRDDAPSLSTTTAEPTRATPTSAATEPSGSSSAPA